MSEAEIARHPRLGGLMAEALAGYNAKSGGSSTRIRRFALLCEGPQVEAGEITDKGYINQRAVREARAEALACLLADAAWVEEAGCSEVHSL